MISSIGKEEVVIMVDDDDEPKSMIDISNNKFI